MKTQLSIPLIKNGQETLTFEYMAGRHTFDSFVTHLRRQRREQRDQRPHQRQKKVSQPKGRLTHEAQKILRLACISACVSLALVLLFAIIDFAA